MILLVLVGVLSLVSIVGIGLVIVILIRNNFSCFPSYKKSTDEVARPTPLYATPDQDEIELERQKRQIQAEVEAFQELMNFNADKAYGKGNING